MKNLSRIVSLIVVFVMVLGTCAVNATDDRVEISFCVGDETLIINGNPVTVEKPYVVGDGVTLVPLRVITEAFGAKVDWEDATQTITLSYPDVSIVLQIGNPVAEVNGKAETLLAAPELPTEYTMVPLRFISETFGANVSYDEATERITVIKEKSQNEGMVVGAIDSDKVGDSYYNWSIENPDNMEMTEREFDGTYTSFENENGFFYILINFVEDDYDLEKHFVDAKASLQGSTLIKADKDASNPNKKTMHFKAKKQEAMLNVRYIVTDEYIYEIYGVFSNEDSENAEECVRIMETFDLGFDGSNTYDLSNVKNGMRRFESEKLKASFDIPQDYYRSSSEDSENSFEFNSLKFDDDISYISFSVYSKSEVGDAKALAEKDFTHNKKNANERISTFSEEIKEGSYAGIPVYEYEYTAEPVGGSRYTRDVFFEKGDYTYNMAICVKQPMDKTDKFVESILNSISIDTIDKNEAGLLMRNFPEATGMFTAKMEDATIELPNIYQESAGNPAVYFNPVNGVMMTFQKINMAKDSTFDDVYKSTQRMEEEVGLQSNNEITVRTRTMSFAGFRFGGFTVRTDYGDEVSYTEQYAMYNNNASYVFIVAYPEDTYSEANRQEVMNIVKSLKFK